MTVENPLRAEAFADAPAERVRYVFLDALRGIAALAVVICHLTYTPLTPMIQSVISVRGIALMDRGRLGVEIFFVISGFVIAHSLRNTVLTARHAAAFTLRRQLRLDPPYWAAVILTLAWGAGYMVVMHNPAAKLPPMRDILANVFYLHEILGQDAIVRVAWTLCIEIQFYLFFIAVMWLLQRCRPAGKPNGLTLAVILGTGLLSLKFRPEKEGVPWMTTYWCYFAAGVLCKWALAKTSPDWVFWILITGLIVTAYAVGFAAPIVVGTATALSIFAVGKAGLLPTLTGGWLLQYLGTISYSLYLVHSVVIQIVMMAGHLLTHANRPAAIGWAVVTLFACVGAADLFYRVVERPSVRWAKSFRSAPAAKAEALP